MFKSWLIGFTGWFIMGLICFYLMFSGGFHIEGVVILYLVLSIFTGLFGGLFSVGRVELDDVKESVE